MAGRLIAIVGPTATGKTALGVHLAESLGGEVISCDSTAVYRGIDIGTDKPGMEERRGIPHHLIDVVDPRETYSAARYAADAAAAPAVRLPDTNAISESSARARATSSAESTS